MIVFCILVAILEAFFRIRNRYSMGLLKTPKVTNSEGKIRTLTPAQIDQQVEEGKPLVIFDNLVLNLQGFVRHHPGGKFNLTHNLGRDISKFFFGGYKLINMPKTFPYTHSKAALDIVNTLVVGVIKGQESVTDELFRITNKSSVNQSTSTFTFTSIDNEPVTNLKEWYNDPSMIGCHFLVFSVRSPNVKRQYTVCSTMQEHIYQDLISMANQILEGRSLKFNRNLLQGLDQNQIRLTVKSY